MEKIKACSFCKRHKQGSCQGAFYTEESFLYGTKFEGRWQVSCCCGREGPKAITKEKAIEFWNEDN